MTVDSASKRRRRLAAVLLAAALFPTIPPPAQAADDTLRRSVQQLQQFPFQPDCEGNTQEIVACLWRQRNQGDATLQQLLGSPALLERWRTSRRQVCERAARKAEGGSIHPIVWLSCENKLTAALLREIDQPLLP
jgi:hypothetical protein